jgi:hypothetical protein
MSMSAPCVAKGGCSYLRTIARLEQLAGFDRTAHLYEQAAARCKTEGCWAAQRGEAATGAAVADQSPIRLKAVVMPPKPSVILPPSRAVDAIPFDRSALVDRVSDGAGNYVETRTLRLESLTDRTDSLGYIFQYWRQLFAGTECTLSNIDTIHLERAGIIGKLHIVDVGSSDPADFRYDLLGYAVPVGYIEKPCAHPVEIYAGRVIHDYNLVRLTAAPRLQRIRSQLGGLSYHYTRLTLPFQDARGGVTRLAVAIRQEPGDGAKVETGNQLGAAHIRDEKSVWTLS